jgi:hypothetical protein
VNLTTAADSGQHSTACYRRWNDAIQISIASESHQEAHGVVATDRGGRRQGHGQEIWWTPARGKSLIPIIPSSPAWLLRVGWPWELLGAPETLHGPGGDRKRQHLAVLLRAASTWWGKQRGRERDWEAESGWRSIRVPKQFIRWFYRVGGEVGSDVSAAMTAEMRRWRWAPTVHESLRSDWRRTKMD